MAQSQNPGPQRVTVESESALIQELCKYAKYKARSDETHDRDHAPALTSRKPITCLLLGHSFFERFKTTGASTRFGPEQAPYPDFFNAGVGGDSISNVIYRLTEKGLLKYLHEAGVKYALLAMGTNDLKDDRRALQPVHIEQYTLIIRALQEACSGVKILVCGIAPKKRIKSEHIVEASNQKLEAMVESIAKSDPESSAVEFMPSDPELINNLELDGVHLNVKGYEMFAEALWTYYEAMRAKYET